MKLPVSPCIALLIMAVILTNGCSKNISNAPVPPVHQADLADMLDVLWA